jgi:glycosyltransferase involved in cell wall biosynthesis
MRYNILYVFDNMEFGGGERGFVQIINRLCRKKYNIMVACLSRGVLIEKIKGSGVQINSVDMQNRFNPMVILQLVSLMKRENVDIVHSQGTRADFFARVAAKLAGVLIVVSTVQMPVEGFDVSLVRKLIYTLLNRFSEHFVDRFIVVSDALVNTMVGYHKVEPQRVVKIYNGIEKDEYGISDEEIVCGRSRFRKEFGLGEDVLIVGAIGRLVWQKGFEYLIGAIPEVSKKYPEAKFLLVGEGLLEDALKAKSKKLKIKDKIIFAGFRDDIKDILASIDIFVMPSLLEGLPMILLESMAMGKSIIATDIDGINEVLEDRNSGLLVPPKDSKALANSILDLIVHKSKACKMGEEARTVMNERFSVNTMVEKVEAVYQELLEK